MTKVIDYIPDECPYCGESWPLDESDPRLVKNGGDLKAFVPIINDTGGENADSPIGGWNTVWACVCRGGCGRPFVVTLTLSPLFREWRDGMDDAKSAYPTEAPA